MVICVLGMKKCFFGEDCVLGVLSVRLYWLLLVGLEVVLVIVFIICLLLFMFCGFVGYIIRVLFLFNWLLNMIMCIGLLNVLFI